MVTKQDIIDYVIKTPYNANPAVLNSLLDQLSSGGQDIDLSKVTATQDKIIDGFVGVSSEGELITGTALALNEGEHYANEADITVLGEDNVAFRFNKTTKVVSKVKGQNEPTAYFYFYFTPENNYTVSQRVISDTLNAEFKTAEGTEWVAPVMSGTTGTVTLDGKVITITDYKTPLSNMHCTLTNVEEGAIYVLRVPAVMAETTIPGSEENGDQTI